MAGRYVALALFLAAPVLGLASAFRFAAQYFFILSPNAFRWAAVNLRPFLFAGAGPALFGSGAAVGAVAMSSGFLGGRPRRFVGPWRASMARLNLSLSAINRAMMDSVGIQRIVTRWNTPNRLSMA